LHRIVDAQVKRITDPELIYTKTLKNLSYFSKFSFSDIMKLPPNKIDRGKKPNVAARRAQAKLGSDESSVKNNGKKRWG